MNYQQYFEKGLTYNQYTTNMITELDGGVETKYSKYLPLNVQRTKRLGKTLRLREKILTSISELDEPLNWLIITEAWCGDSSQSLPIINAISEASEGKIKLRIVYRDQNPELIQKHLTNGAMSIPVLIQLDASYNLIGQWGPRPEDAQNLVITLKSDPATAQVYSEELHKWYAMDKTNSIQTELLNLLNGLQIEV